MFILCPIGLNPQEIAGSVVGAVIAAVLIVAVVVMLGVFVHCTKCRRTEQPNPQSDMRWVPGQKEGS